MATGTSLQTEVVVLGSDDPGGGRSGPPDEGLGDGLDAFVEDAAR